MDEPVLTINDRVTVLMRRRGDSMRSVAESLGVHPETIRRRLLDGKPWQLHELAHLANRYEVPIDWLLGEGK